ncbi:hypothetical protein E3N88_39439 [Mikania micrantha]|uniref:Integrase catalytic domain-containing protein n=1 Tax=Mikania micrantha TaxID=192012 RepID=A0A5N6LZE7_9ASTR|nr:hypothetical protein E3N88_39439 [Mikania micrantha]
MSKTIIEVTSHTHFPIKLTPANYPSWRKQVMATLVGLGLESFVDGSAQPPSKNLPSDITKPNPDYTRWFRQDQIILGAILGSCSDSIQHIVASADTSWQAFEQLNASYASTSRSRIISLKSRLGKNPKGSRSMTEFLHDMKSIADELALARSPVTDDDLIVHIVNQLGDDYAHIAAAIKMRDTAITFADLFDKLVDHERNLLETQPTSPIVTINTAQRFSTRNTTRPASDSRGSQRFPSTGSRFAKTTQQGWNNNTPRGKSTRFCQFCSIPGHETNDCRKLARFLKENNIRISTNPPPIPMVNTSSARASSQNPSWMMFDTGASDHAVPESASLHTLSEYGGPDEIVLGNDNGGEFIALTPYLQQNGISHLTTPAHTPEQNGTAERRHRHIVETGLSLLHHAKLPLTFWSHAFQTAVHLINRLPTPLLELKSPYDQLYKTSPGYSKLKPFGCLCYPWLRPYASSKLHPRSLKCIFLGYSSSKSAFKCYDPVLNRLYHSRHVEFVEHIFPYANANATVTTLPTVTTFLNIKNNNPNPIIPHTHANSSIQTTDVPITSPPTNFHAPTNIPTSSHAQTHMGPNDSMAPTHPTQTSSSPLPSPTAPSHPNNQTHHTVQLSPSPPITTSNTNTNPLPQSAPSARPSNDNKESSMRSFCKDLSSKVQESRKKEDASLRM